MEAQIGGGAGVVHSSVKRFYFKKTKPHSLKAVNNFPRSRSTHSGGGFHGFRRLRITGWFPPNGSQQPGNHPTYSEQLTLIRTLFVPFFPFPAGVKAPARLNGSGRSAQKLFTGGCADVKSSKPPTWIRCEQQGRFLFHADPSKVPRSLRIGNNFRKG